ncbi:FMN-binding negative transcriptional regulator [Arenicella xantha]|uniref:PaiB family negative transcriptional regulator n=1 Tax=Arenicella xantha TaxID=644221 RepID=A0A395JMH4_9GAMM|nr:FMN-binding negative transcriptional regulator [Arenicella xantha]RBP52749.1 PaiB family negative transcriptional regulator [Arenicella xantha]
MHIPKVFQQQNQEQLLNVVKQYPFASLIVTSASGLEVNHIPLIYREVSGAPVLQGHIAKVNPVWQSLSDGSEALAVFSGPNCYVSPSYYPTKRENGRAVPTWNYVAVHVSGLIRFIHDAQWNESMLRELTLEHEAGRAEPWSLDDAPRAYIDKLLPAIVGVELSSLSFSGKWKLSQNQPPRNQLGVVSGLEQEPSDAAQKIAQLVRNIANY